MGIKLIVAFKTEGKPISHVYQFILNKTIAYLHEQLASLISKEALVQVPTNFKKA